MEKLVKFGLGLTSVLSRSVKLQPQFILKIMLFVKVFNKDIGSNYKTPAMTENGRLDIGCERIFQRGPAGLVCRTEFLAPCKVT